MSALNPDFAASWLRHTALGLSIRQIARIEGVEPSTVLRRVRAVEERADCPVWAHILDRLTVAAKDGARVPAARADLLHLLGTDEVEVAAGLAATGAAQRGGLPAWIALALALDRAAVMVAPS